MTTTMDSHKIYLLADAKIKLVEELRALNITNRLLFHQSSAYRVEVRVEDTDALLWLTAQKTATKIFWEDRTRECTVALAGAADILTAKSGETYADFMTRLQKNLSSKFPDLRYYGGFCFNPNYPTQGEWQNWNLARFVLPLIELRRTKEGTTLACNILLTRDFKNTINHACKELDHLQMPDPRYTGTLASPYRRTNFPDESTWKASVAHIVNGIHEGKYQKLVLARAVRLDFLESLNPFFLMSQLRETVSNCFSFIFQIENGECFLGTSPERLYCRKGESIQTEALAGTRPRGEIEAEDITLQNQLLGSQKDLNEQSFVVDMIKNNLKPLCDSLRTDEKPSLLKWSAGHHLITRFEGTLKKGVTDAALIASLHPTPAVAGTPATTALKSLIQIEKFDRGWYCGPIGYVASTESEFAVAIRCGLLKNRNLYLYAGAGIIKESIPEAEWTETEGKLSNFFKIFDANKK